MARESDENAAAAEVLKLPEIVRENRSCVPPLPRAASAALTDEEKNRKLREFLKKKHASEEAERQRKLKALEAEKEELIRRRERVLSACGIRQLGYCESPRAKPATPKAAEATPTHSNVSLGPKPSPLANLNAKLPPKPKGNRPSEQPKGVLQSAARAALGRPDSARLPRSSSAHRIVYPSWWG